MINTSIKNKQCTLLWALNQKYWGQGYSEEILKSMIKYLFEEHPFEIIVVNYYCVLYNWITFRFKYRGNVIIRGKSYFYLLFFS